MIKSMTGFGRTEININNKKITIEVKALNSKQLDINSRMPNVYREKELEMRAILSNSLKRGKVDLGIQVDQSNDSANYSLNTELAKKYYTELKNLSSEIDEGSFTDYLPILVRMPDVLKPEKEALEIDEWNAIKIGLNQALDLLNDFRVEEGKALLKDLIHCVENIQSLLEEIPNFESERISLLKARISKDLEEMTQSKGYDKNRFEQELIYYLEKLDINEEKVRLKKHCSYFVETLEQEESMGKKLGFIAQEMGREINTIGSKANHAEIQKLVVQMKDQLEKIKEQLFNIL